MFASKKEFQELKDDFNKLSEKHDHLVDVVIKLEKEIQELKKPKKPSYMA